MAAVARFLAERGCQVDGCDASPGVVGQELSRVGVAVAGSHDVSHVDGVDLVLASVAISRDLDELVAADRSRAWTPLRREFLGELSRRESVVGFAGTHGKTTSASMAAHVYSCAGRAPSWIIGASLPGLGASGRGDHGDRLICEVDESYGAFTDMDLTALGLLNVDPDHLDHYGTFEELLDAFVGLVNRTRGPRVLWSDHPGSAAVAQRSDVDVDTVGERPGSTWRLHDVQLDAQGSRWSLDGPAGDLDLVVSVPGAHNVANASVVAAVALRDGVDVEAVRDGLTAFPGLRDASSAVAPLTEHW
jgi:UDP-N-acetylmuramate--alanine ligase